MTLNELFKNTTYDDTLFSVEAKSTIESRIFMKSVRGSEVPYITCAIRDKEIKLTPEEAVRQLYIYKLMNDYGYAASRIQLETPIHFGREVKRADIAIMDKDRPMVPYIIVELKKPKLTDGKEQLKSYCNATGAPIGVWTNGEQISCYNRKDPNFFEEISDIPKATQKLSDIINEKFTYEDLKRKDKISTQKKSLRSLIKEMEDEVLASAGVDSFEEIFKLIFTKLYDELICANDPTAYLQFRNTGDTDYELKEKIQGLFDDAKKKWEGIFTDESKILLSPSHLAVCVASLQDIKLFNNNLDVVDDAFEYLMSKAQKGEKGQYFTPRYVIDMCVKMMNPTTKDKIIDTACGSSGFTVHSIFKVWKDIRRGKGLPEGDGFTAAERIPEETNFVRDNVFAIDFDEKTVRVCSATSFLRNWDSILEKKRANLRSISEPARLRQPPPRSTGSAHARGQAQSIREERRIAAPPVLFALLWVIGYYRPFTGRFAGLYGPSTGVPGALLLRLESAFLLRRQILGDGDDVLLGQGLNIALAVLHQNGIDGNHVLFHFHFACPPSICLILLSRLDTFSVSPTTSSKRPAIAS